MVNVCHRIYEEIRDLFNCSQSREYIRIETPFLYPDGDIIDLFYKESLLDKKISDLGGASDWLGLQSLSETRTEKQEEQIESICTGHGVEFYKGEFFIDLGKGNEERSLTECIFDLSQAIVRVSSLWFLQINKVKNSVIDILENLIKENNITYEKNKNFNGISGRDWKTSFYTETEHKNCLIYVLSTANKTSASGMLYRIYSAWNDLIYLKTDTNKIINKEIEFISLFDDRYPVWTAKDRNLVKAVSTVKQLSHKNDFKNTLMGIS